MMLLHGSISGGESIHPSGFSFFHLSISFNAPSIFSVSLLANSAVQLRLNTALTDLNLSDFICLYKFRRTKLKTNDRRCISIERTYATRMNTYLTYISDASIGIIRKIHARNVNASESAIDSEQTPIYPREPRLFFSGRNFTNPSRRNSLVSSSLYLPRTTITHRMHSRRVYARTHARTARITRARTCTRA